MVEKDNLDIYDLVYNRGYKADAMATTLGNLETSEAAKFWSDWGRDWTEVKCNGSKVLVLKNPTKAFDFYATTWNTKFDAAIELLNQVKVKVKGQLSKKIEKLFDNLNYVNMEIRQMYFNSYLTFMAAACSEKAQEEKRKMDRVVAAATMHLVSFKMMLESSGTKDLDKINEQLIRLVEKISDLILKD